MMVTWREQLEQALAEHGESWDDIENTTLTADQLDFAFWAGYGTAQGHSFTLWTQNRVYFPAVYDGAEWVASVARHPNAAATEHIGCQ